MGKQPLEIIKAPYPLFAVEILTVKEGDDEKEMVIYGGGGGSSACGIPNGMQMHRFDKEYSVFSKVDTQKDAVMNFSVNPKTKAVVCGLDCATKAYSFPQLEYLEIEKETEKGDDNYQKVTKFNESGSLVATGGAEGIVRVWSYPAFDLKKEYKIEDEIQDLQWHPSNGSLACVCRNGFIYVLHCKVDSKEKIEKDTTNNSADDNNDNDDNKLEEIKDEDNLIDPPLKLIEDGVKFSMVGCSYITSDQRNFLFVVATHSKKGTYALFYDVLDYKVSKKVKIGKENVLKFKMSPCEKYFAIGTRNGVVVIWETDSLKRVTTNQAHGLFVASIAWGVKSDKVITCSGDCLVVQTNLEYTEGLSLQLVILLLLTVILFLIYLFAM